LSAIGPETQPVPLIPDSGSAVSRLRFWDYLLLIAFCGLLFGYVAVSGRPLTLHEARLPETSREMLARHDWLLPMDGNRPWLERPPFPHWCMMAVAKVIGQRCDTEWSVRIPPSLAGLLIVILAAQIAAKWFSRNIGLISGLLLATMYEFYAYSTLAEDDIFLGLLVVLAIALFVRMEFAASPRAENARVGFLNGRPWTMAAFFVVLGLTNLAKGPIVGAAVVIGTIVAYFLMPRLRWQPEGDFSLIFDFHVEQRRRMRQYLWLWGILAALVIALSWHLYMARMFPGKGGYWENLKYDFSQTHEFDEPWWYYPVNLLGRGMPWTPAAILALFLTARPAWITRDRVMQFLWCWAIVPIVVLSLPHRKHHHYLVPSLAPWAILAAVGLHWYAKEIFKGPEWSRRPRFGLLVVGLPVTIGIAILAWFRLLSPARDVRSQLISAAILVVLVNACVTVFYWGLLKQKPRWLLIAVLAGTGGAFSWSQTHLRDETVPDTVFLRNDVEARVPKDELLAIDGAIGPLNFFRVQFYLRADALMLHNLSYLRSDRIATNDVYVVAQLQDLDELKSLGTAELVAFSTRPKQKDVPQLALFHVTFSPGLKRYPPPKVSVMQAMMREDGPWCGPEMRELAGGAAASNLSGE
jgi:4-amino-4-deoxy-L-arabinose transferase-like glycosyltransferase